MLGQSPAPSQGWVLCSCPPSCLMPCLCYACSSKDGAIEGSAAARELVVIYTDSLYTAYRAVLRGSIEVAVQVTKERVGVSCAAGTQEIAGQSCC